MNFFLFVQDTLGNMSDYAYQYLSDITIATAETAQHTDFDFIKDGLNAVAILGVLITLITLWEQRHTANNTQKLSRDAQRSLLIDLVRHLYRNLVIVYTVKTKLIDKHYQGYPSEEHLIKLKVPMENIHLDSFYGRNREYQLMHNLYLNLRNYNDEIDIICAHLKDPNIPQEAKERDIATLLFKSSFLTERITIILYAIWDNKTILVDFNNPNKNKEIKTLLRTTSNNTIAMVKNKIIEAQNGISNASNNQEVESAKNFNKYNTSKNVYAELIFTDKDEFNDFLSKLNNDIRVERGKNAQGGDKIYIIDYPTTTSHCE